jgi:CheY-like chemotaxis protein
VTPDDNEKPPPCPWCNVSGVTTADKHQQMAEQRMLRVLVVDDEAAILTFAGRVLRDAGHEVVVASDGLEALRIVYAQRPFDVFVVDVLMPQMRGDELARHLRQMDQDVKVLYLTGDSDRLFKEKVTLWEHEAFVDKPVSGTGLLEAVSLLLFEHTHGLGV